jgi:hypothetical protein
MTAPLPHLDGASRGLRQAMAAHFAGSLPHVVEIGGAGLPVTEFLRGPRTSVTVVDPKIEAFEAAALHGLPCRVRHIAAKAQAVPDLMPRGPYALAMLGLSLKPLGRGPVLPEALARLVAGAARLIVDHALDLGRATEQLPAILGASGLPVAVRIDYSLADGAIEAAGYGRRRFLVLGDPGP